MSKSAVEDNRNSSVSSSVVGQCLSLLNSLLTISLKNISLEQQLLSALDLLLGVPWLPLYPRAALFLLNEDRNVLELVASIGLPDAIVVGCEQVTIGDCICGRVAATGEPVCSDRVDVRNVACYDRMPHYSVPLRESGKTMGVLTLYLKDGCSFYPETAAFLEVAAMTFVSIIVKSRAVENGRRHLNENRNLNKRIIALQEEEYRHMARELHDEIGQSIAAIKTEAALLLTASAKDEMQSGVKIIGDAADRIYEVMREEVRRLRPGMLDDLGLLPAIETLVTEWRRQRPSVSCQLDVHGRFDDIDDTTKITIYRFVQECLTNIARHSAATEVKIGLSRQFASPEPGARGTIMLGVSDNGRGTEVGRLRGPSARFGLLAMRERVEGLGGTLAIESAPGRGFKLSAKIPMPERRKR